MRSIPRRHIDSPDLETAHLLTFRHLRGSRSPRMALSPSRQLPWDKLDATAFERLIYNLVATAEGYENPQWLTHATAPDRGRDLSVRRVVPDSLSATRREYVIIQCKHWLARSIAPKELNDAYGRAIEWDPPADVLIIATSGRFTSAAEDWINRHNAERRRPAIEPWASSHLELHVAQRPYLADAVGL